MATRQAQKVQVQLMIQSQQNSKIDNYAINELGEAIKIGSQLYIRYQENKDTKVLIKISTNNLLTIKRQVHNLPTTKLVFSRQDDQELTYPTEYGSLSLTTHTKKMHLLISQAPLSGTIALDYSLSSQNNLVGDYKLRLIFNS